MLLDAIDHRVTLNATEATAEEFHDSRIGIHCGKRFPILVTPSTQADAAVGQCRKGAHRCAILCLKTCNGQSAAGQSRRDSHAPFAAYRPKAHEVEWLVPNSLDSFEISTWLPTLSLSVVLPQPVKPPPSRKARSSGVVARP